MPNETTNPPKITLHSKAVQALHTLKKMPQLGVNLSYVESPPLLTLYLTPNCHFHSRYEAEVFGRKLAYLCSQNPGSWRPLHLVEEDKDSLVPAWKATLDLASSDDSKFQPEALVRIEKSVAGIRANSDQIIDLLQEHGVEMPELKGFGSTRGK